MSIPKKEKVLVLLPGFDLGGAEKQGLYIAESLLKSGRYEVEVWGLGLRSGMLVAKFKEIGLAFQVIDIPFSVFQTRVARIKAYWKFLWLLRKSRFDIILPFTYQCNVMAASVYRFAGIKKCLWFQIAMEYHIPLSSFEKIALKMKPTYAANSLAAGKFIADKHGIDASQVAFIPNPFEKIEAKNSSTQWREKLGVDEHDILMVMSANFYPEKDHDTLLHGLKILLSEFPNLVMVFAGSTNPPEQSNRVKALAFDLDIPAASLKFTGSTNDIPGLLAASQIGILSSRSEGSPNALIEYMGYGLPVIATNIPAISELLGNDYPYLFQVENIVDFVNKARQLILQLKESQQLIDNNRNIIETGYTINTNLNAFLRIMTE